jgi:DNA sulfur modification protein DndD
LEAAELERKLRQVKEKRDRYGHLSDKIQRAIDVDLVLDDFAQRLTGQRVAQLAEAFVRNFNRLCRKDQLIQGAKINPRDFSLSLVGDGQGAIVRGELSAGENQIYAIAMLWALRQVSGRPLPLLIDAPLGRLDRDHRQNLVDFYFPRVSHQVILLSTDTEVDAEFFAAMSPQVARAYHLVYDEGRRATVASEGYFWEMNGRGPA